MLTTGLLQSRNSDLIKVRLSETGEGATVSKTLFRIACDNLKRDHLRRWWCKLYNRPPTDPLLLAYTLEELTVEHLEYALDQDLIEIGKDGNPVVIETTPDGAEVARTGFEDWDEEEERWAKQRPLSELLAEKAAQEAAEDGKGDDNILPELVKLALKCKQDVG